MKVEDFKKIIGSDLVVDYNFNGELQKWSLKNFYIGKDNKIYHKRLPLIMEVFIHNCENPHEGKPTHG